MNWSLVHKFLSGQCTASERKDVEEWLKRDPENRELMRTMHKVWEVKPKGEKVNVRKAWERFSDRRMNDNNRSTNWIDKSKSKKVNASLKWYQKTPPYAAAAAILLLVVVYFIARLEIKKSSKVTYQQVVTGRGEKSSLKLNDGTKVQLNAESTLKIPSNYGAKNRALYLKGEAFFSVKHDESKPFRVYSGDIYTEDIGTKFNIQAFHDDSMITVVVAEGKVALEKTSRNKQKSLLISSNERAIISNKGQVDIKKVSDLETYIGWTKNTLVFNNTSFKKVMKHIERWYGIKCITKNNNILEKRLTATFENEPLSNVLELISKSMNIKAKIKNQVVEFDIQDGKEKK